MVRELLAARAHVNLVGAAPEGGGSAPSALALAAAAGSDGAARLAM